MRLIVTYRFHHVLWRINDYYRILNKVKLSGYFNVTIGNPNQHLHKEASIHTNYTALSASTKPTLQSRASSILFTLSDANNDKNTSQEEPTISNTTKSPLGKFPFAINDHPVFTNKDSINSDNNNSQIKYTASIRTSLDDINSSNSTTSSNSTSSVLSMLKKTIVIGMKYSDNVDIMRSNLYSDQSKDKIAGYRGKYLDYRRKGLALTKDWRIYWSRMHLYKKRLKKGISASKPITPKPTPSGPPIVEDINFNGMDNVTIPAVNHHHSLSTWTPTTTHIIRKFVGNQEVPYDPNANYFPSSTDPFSFSIVAVGTYSRIFFIRHLLKRWKGNASLLLYGTEKDEEMIINYLNKRNYPTRLSLLVYLVASTSSEAKVFPINKLRNLSIKNVVTTHYIVLDFDIWPAENAFEAFSSLPKAALMNEKNAIILPIFFYDLGLVLPQCRELSDCIKQGDSIFPENIYSLLACVRTRLCMFHKHNLLTHGYIQMSWFNWKLGSLASLDCVVNDYQEPYVLLKRSPSTPLFDERFVDYGYNKVELIETLRYQLSMNTYAIDMPHRSSSFKKTFTHNFNKTGSIQKLFDEYRKELVAKYGNNPLPHICNKREARNPYKVVLPIF